MPRALFLKWIYDEYALLQTRSSKAIYSHSTALFLLGMTDKIPDIIDITVPQGSNVSSLKKDERLNIHYVNKDIVELGVIEIISPQDSKIKVYDKERSICDIIKNKANIDMQVFIQSIKLYFSSKTDYRKLIKYGKQLNIEDKLRIYMEMLS